jgi:ubiquinone/menaquinone biosynthesis C-methylase UbiE
MLAVTEREAKRRGLTNLETALADAEDLPFEARAFDGVTCRTAAHHFRDPMRFLGEVMRVLKPTGWFLLVDTAGPEDPKANQQLNEIEFWRDPSHVRDHTPSEWKRMLLAAGFEIRTQRLRSKELALGEWLDRMDVQEPTRSRIWDRVQHSEGALLEYLQPQPHEDECTFHLHEIVVLCGIADSPDVG